MNPEYKELEKELMDVYKADRAMSDFSERVITESLFPKKYLPVTRGRAIWLWLTSQEKPINPKWIKIQNQTIKFKRPRS